MQTLQINYSPDKLFIVYLALCHFREMTKNLSVGDDTGFWRRYTNDIDDFTDTMYDALEEQGIIPTRGDKPELLDINIREINNV